MKTMQLKQRVATKANLETVRDENKRRDKAGLEKMSPMVGTIVEVADDGQSGYVTFDGDEEMRIHFHASELELVK
jgi:hypothetical protein